MFKNIPYVTSRIDIKIGVDFTIISVGVEGTNIDGIDVISDKRKSKYI